MSKSRPPEPKPSLSKRQAIREKRRQKQRRNRLTFVLGILAVVVFIAAVLVIPPLLNARDIVQITPVAHPDADGRALGPADAKVTVEVFEDFQCPVCRQFSETTEHQIIDNFVSTGQARYIYRQFPFLDSQSISKESHQAANASMCASEQERFWDYHDMLFANWNGENLGSFSDKRLVEFAKVLGLDTNKFNTCFKANTYKAEIDSDYTRGQNLGVSGTPSVFVNDQRVGSSPQAVPSYDEIAAAINAALASGGN